MIIIKIEIYKKISFCNISKKNTGYIKKIKKDIPTTAYWYGNSETI
tara:strand:+ start:24 stop:161 length:138 start_codon:yes stop_codon:yes gene_type:complete